MLVKKAALISGYLSKKAVAKTDKLAKEARRQFFTIVKDAGGFLSRFDVTNGSIFIELRDDKGYPELQKALADLNDVTLEEVSPIKLVFLKSQAQAESKAE